MGGVPGMHKTCEETPAKQESTIRGKKKTMLFDDISFHDSVIFEVRENTFDQTIDFLLKFPTNWKENIFEKKILRFKNVVVYIKKEIPFSGYPTILDIRLKNTTKHSYNDSLTNVVVSEYKIEIITNAGNRFIEFSNVELINL